MRRCGDIQPNPGPTQSAAAAAAATVDAHHNNVFTPRAVRQSRSRLQRETDLGMLCDREHVPLDPAQKMRIGCTCTRDGCYHHHNFGVTAFVFPALQNGELGIVTWNCTTLRNLTWHDLIVGQADQLSVICLQDTLHWPHDSLQWMAPQSTVHTNVLQLGSVPMRLTAQHADFGMVTVIQGGMSTRLAERTNRILVSDLKLDKGKIAIVNMYAPVQLAKVHVASMRLLRRRESEDQTQYEARQQKEQIAEDIDAFIVSLRSIVQRLHMERIPAVLAGDFNSDVATETPWWLDDVFDGMSQKAFHHAPHAFSFATPISPKRGTLIDGPRASDLQSYPRGSPGPRRKIGSLSCETAPPS